MLAWVLALLVCAFVALFASFVLVVGGWVAALAFLGMLACALGSGFPVREHTGQSCCRRCRYPVVGLLSEICPECGGDLRNDGTLHPGDQPLVRSPRAVAITCRTLIVLLPLTVLLNAELHAKKRIVSTSRAQASSASGLFGSLSISGRAVNARPRSSTSAALVGPARTVRLRVRDEAVRVRYEGPGGQLTSTADAMTDDDVLAWMARSGIDISHERAPAEASAIAMLIRHVVAGGRAFLNPPTSSPMAALTNASVTTNSVATGRWWVIALLIAAAVAMWSVFMADMIPWKRLGRPSCARGKTQRVTEPRAIGG
jgi:hypothetical protein